MVLHPDPIDDRVTEELYEDQDTSTSIGTMSVYDSEYAINDAISVTTLDTMSEENHNEVVLNVEERIGADTDEAITEHPEPSLDIGLALPENDVPTEPTVDHEITQDTVNEGRYNLRPRGLTWKDGRAVDRADRYGLHISVRKAMEKFGTKAMK